MKNIAILSYSLTGGGAERIAGLLSKYLAEKYNVYLFLHDSKVITYDYAGQIVDLSVNGEENVEQTLKECKRKYKIDCAISFLIIMNCLNVRTGGKESIILSNRCSFGEVKPYPYGDSKRIKTWYNEADRIVSCSYGAKYDLVHNFGIDSDIITPIYNFIDKKAILENANGTLRDEVYSFAGESKIILNVGRLDEQKNQCKLLVQFAKLVEEGYDVKLIILGSGYMESVLKELVQNLGIQSKVLFETYCKNPFSYYRLADIMAFSTDYEGLPNVVLEAMTLGLPVVSVDCLSGPLELIKGSYDYSVRTNKIDVCERGILVQQAESDRSGKTSYLAEGIKKLLDDEKLCQQISFNEKKFMENYSNDEILDAWIQVIETATPKTKRTTKHILNDLDNETKVIVYGAGVYGKAIMRYIMKKKTSYDLLCFAVTDKTSNPEKVYGYSVYQIEELLKYREDAIVVVAVSEKFEKEIKDILDKYKFKYIFSDI